MFAEIDLRTEMERLDVDHAFFWDAFFRFVMKGIRTSQMRERAKLGNTRR